MRLALAILTLLSWAGCYLVDGDDDDLSGEPFDEGDGAPDPDTDPDPDAAVDDERVLDPEEVAQAVADAEDYCDQLAEAACAALAGCCAQGWNAGRTRECIGNFADGCRRDLVPSAEQLYLTVAPGGTEARVATIQQTYASCPPGPVSPDVLPGCTSALITSAPTGGCCGGSTLSGCDYGLGCSVIDDETCEEGAVCAELPGDGERCLGAGLCQRGLYCDEQRLCRRLPREGERCLHYTAPECEGGLFCHPITELCQPRALAGEPCDEITQCLEGTSCDAEQGLCVADARSPYCTIHSSWNSTGGY